MGAPEQKSAKNDLLPSPESGADPLPDTQRALLVLLFNKYRGALLRHLERLVHSREDAAELVQETYLRVLSRIQTSRFEAAARAYLFHTATNLARDHFRRQRFRAHDRLDELSDADLRSPVRGVRARGWPWCEVELVPRVLRELVGVLEVGPLLMRVLLRR